MKLVAWLVPPAGTTAAQLTSILNAVNAAKNEFRISWGGWEYPDEKDARPAVQKVALPGRWDAGIDVIRVNTQTLQTYYDANAAADAIQIITTGHSTRFWEKEYFSCRHIMAALLAKTVFPTGFTTPWKNQFVALMQFYPFENFRERKVWNGHTLVGNYLGKRIYSGTLSSVSNFAPVWPNASAITYPALRATTTNAAITRANQGRNDVDTTGVTFTINFSFTAIPVPDDTYFNGLTDGATVSPAVRSRAADLGLNVTVNNSNNVTGAQYVRPDSDVLLKALRAHNTYFKKFGVLDPGYSGEIKEDRADFINGGTYANNFRLGSGATFDGRSIATGGWGGRGTLHGWNERIELDGIVDFTKRMARIFMEWAAGVPHKWEVSGNGSTALPHKKRLQYAERNSAVPGIYIQEETTAKLAIADLYAKDLLPRDEVTEILFARKFRMDNLTGATPAMTLTTTLINNDGTDKTAGTVYMLARPATGTDWNIVNKGTNGVATFVFEAGSIYDTTAAASADIVEVEVIALVKTNGASVPLSVEGGEIVENGKVEDRIDDAIDDKTGCNAGFALFALLALCPIFMRRK
jgi:hypothetical protein